MGRKKSKGSEVTEAPTDNPPTDNPPTDNPPTEHPAHSTVPFFPFLRYSSIVGVHTTLLLFAVLFLPQSKIFGLLYTDHVPTSSFFPKTQQSSADRPPSQFVANLTASPSLTMACICFGSALLQAWWAGWLRSWAIDFMLSERGVTDKQERRMEIGKIDETKYTTILHAWIATFATSFIFHLVLILFGSPIITHVPHTYLLALTFAFLTIFPPAYTLGVPKSTSSVARLTWTRLYAELSPRNAIERALVYPTVGTSVGCWAGAIPCALDWDRPWQAWPLPLAFGAIIGYILGSLVALTASAIDTLVEIGRTAKRDEALQVEREISESQKTSSSKKAKKTSAVPIS